MIIVYLDPWSSARGKGCVGYFRDPRPETSDPCFRTVQGLADLSHRELHVTSSLRTMSLNTSLDYELCFPGPGMRSKSLGSGNSGLNEKR